MATIKSVKDNTTLPGHLPALVEALRPAVETAQDPADDLLARAIRRNVALNVEKLKTAALILKSRVDKNKIRVVGGLYELQTGRVRLLA